MALLPGSLPLQRSGDLKFTSCVIRIKLSKRLSRAYTLGEEHCGILSPQQCINKKFEEIQRARPLRTAEADNRAHFSQSKAAQAPIAPSYVAEMSNSLKQSGNRANTDAFQVLESGERESS